MMAPALNRRDLLKTTSAGILLTSVGIGWAQSGSRQLPLIPMTDLIGGIDDRITLSLNAGMHDFGNGAASPTFGINNS